MSATTPALDGTAEIETESAQARELLATLLELRQHVVAEGDTLYSSWLPLIQRREFLPSALNLAHYLALRRRDLRQLQEHLAPWGLSSLGRSEARVLPNLDAVIATLGAVAGDNSTALPVHPSARAFFRGQRLLARASDQLFGPPPASRRVRVMVTFPSEAATDFALVRGLLEQGMNCARINCAHDGPAEWEAMIRHVRRAEAELQRGCMIEMDLAGPKVRTAAVITPDRRLSAGDLLHLTRLDPTPRPDVSFQARCTLPAALDHLTVGAVVWLDDGKVGGITEAITNSGALVRITHAPPKGLKLRAEKGINFPDTDLELSALTDDDLQVLDFVALHADAIGYSFVQDPTDVQQLQRELRHRLGERPLPALIAKIETSRAVRNLPLLIVHAAAVQPFGVMIARGDLAVEIGYQRLAEIQEEILWICEAAHVPVVWATEVLERFVRKGTPSRGEMTDAAMAARAECVMLNKGPYVAEAVAILDDVLTRMQAHQTKKTPQLRLLHAWEGIHA